MPDELLNTAAELVEVGRLKTHPRNVNQGDLGVIMESIAEHGFYGALVAQRATRFILAGNHRYRAAVELGYTRLPVCWVDVDDRAAMRILLVDNRATRLGTDDPQALADLLAELSAEGPQGLHGTGYDGDFLDALIADLAAPLKLPQEKPPPEEFPEYDEALPTQFCCPKCNYKWSGKAGVAPAKKTDQDDDA